MKPLFRRSQTTKEVAARIAATALQQRLVMQNEYDMLMAERNDSFMEKLRQIRRIAAIF